MRNDDEKLIVTYASERFASWRSWIAVLGSVAPCLVVGVSPAVAGSVSVAVAANFAAVATEIGALFENESGNKVVFSFGATGQLYAQIVQGAPFDVFLSADGERTKIAIQEGHAVAGTDFTYAYGRLVLFSSDPTLVKGEATLRQASFDRIAIANPTVAPYGAAAIDAMKALGVHEAVKSKIVRGQNIAQTYQFVATGNAQLGFVALSQVVDRSDGSRWLVPRTVHRPIAQNAVLTKRGEHNEVARAFLSFLKGSQAKAVIEKFGYGTSPQ